MENSIYARCAHQRTRTRHFSTILAESTVGHHAVLLQGDISSHTQFVLFDRTRFAYVADTEHNSILFHGLQVGFSKKKKKKEALTLNDNPSAGFGGTMRTHLKQCFKWGLTRKHRKRALEDLNSQQQGEKRAKRVVYGTARLLAH